MSTDLISCLTPLRSLLLILTILFSFFFRIHSIDHHLRQISRDVLPDCVSTCSSPMIDNNPNGCSNTDYVCLCNSRPTLDQMENCYITNCSIPDAQIGQSFLRHMCSLSGFNVTFNPTVLFTSLPSQPTSISFTHINNSQNQNLMDSKPLSPQSNSSHKPTPLSGPGPHSSNTSSVFSSALSLRPTAFILNSFQFISYAFAAKSVWEFYM